MGGFSSRFAQLIVHHHLDIILSEIRSIWHVALPYGPLPRYFKLRPSSILLLAKNGPILSFKIKNCVFSPFCRLLIYKKHWIWWWSPITRWTKWGRIKNDRSWLSSSHKTIWLVWMIYSTGFKYSQNCHMQPSVGPWQKGHIRQGVA